MDFSIVEIKARSKEQDRIREILKSNNADFKGLDHQIDTYFNVPSGRLKLREGKVENKLIYYNRQDKDGPKQSSGVLFDTDPGSSLKELLIQSLGIKVVVDKKREIYFIDNVKFHIDDVKGLGKFVEIEAIDNEGRFGKERLLEQCQHFMKLFNITQEDTMSVSYSDMILKEK
jgi:predicted adenylyl cyclase CyaB